MKKSLWMQSVRRNVYYWGRAVEGIILVFICIDLCYAALFGMTGQEASESIRQTGVMRLVLGNARNYMIGMGLMMPMVIPGSYGKNGIGLTISFGGKRSETVCGVQFMHFLVIVQVTLYVALLNLLLEDSWIWFPLYFAGMIISAALGQLLLCAQLRFGTKGVVFTVLAITAAAITAIFLLAAGWSETWGGTLGIFWLDEPGGLLKFFTAALYAVGAVLYAVSVMLLIGIVKKYEVRI